MKKKLSWIICTVLVLCALAVACTFFGNPVSWALVWFRANAYLDATYPELDLKIDSMVYDYLFGGYDVDVISPTSRDTYFTLTCNGLGSVQYDRYNAVASGGTTAARLSKAYESMVAEAFRQEDAPFEAGSVYSELCSQATIEYYSVATANGTEMRTMEKDFSMDLSALELDRDYDIASLGMAHGQLTIVVEDEDVSIEQAAALLLKLKEFMDEQGVPFYAVEFWLCPIPREGVTYTDADTICLWDFLYSDIYQDGLTDRVRKAYEEYLWHYEQMHP